MTEDLLRRADALIANTAQTREEVASRLQHLEEQVRVRRKERSEAEEALRSAQHKSWLATVAALIASLLALTAAVIASESFSVHVFSVAAGVLIAMVGIFAGRYESVVRKRVAVLVRRGEPPRG